MGGVVLLALAFALVLAVLVTQVFCLFRGVLRDDEKG